MFFETGHLYHIFNQGNNRVPIFFSRENYLFFLRKINRFVLPYADILAWCLMPNHFHLMVYVHTTEYPVYPIDRENATPEMLQAGTVFLRSFNDSIGILQRSYTRAINLQNHSTGSLFRKNCKAVCLNPVNGVSPAFYYAHFGTRINVVNSEKEYPQACFHYIHLNPVKARLVKHPEDWEFSSYSDYSGKRNGSLVNKTRAAEFVTW